jgi:transposase-like protein
MNVHKMARTAPWSRAEIARRRAAGQSIARIARDFGISDKTVRKWCGRGDSPTDRSSRPKTSPTQLPEVWADGGRPLRRLRFTQERIAVALQPERSTVARVCAHAGLARLSALDPKQPIQRYTRERPGEIIHLDTKKLGHFIKTIERVMTDNGSAYVSGAFAAVVVGLGAVHSGPGRFTPQPTAEPSASSSPCFAPGPMFDRTSTPPREPKRSSPGSTGTTDSEVMQDISARPHSKRYPRSPGTTS